MLDRIRALIDEKAAANAAHEGAPVGIVHLHGAAHEITLLVMQARDQLIAGHRVPAITAAPITPKAEAPVATSGEPAPAVPEEPAPSAAQAAEEPAPEEPAQVAAERKGRRTSA